MDQVEDVAQRQVQMCYKLLKALEAQKHIPSLKAFMHQQQPLQMAMTTPLKQPKEGLFKDCSNSRE